MSTIRLGAGSGTDVRASARRSPVAGQSHARARPPAPPGSSEPVRSARRVPLATRESILLLQRSVGNRSVQRLAGAGATPRHGAAAVPAEPRSAPPTAGAGVHPHRPRGPADAVVQRQQTRRPPLLLPGDTYILGRKNVRLFEATTPFHRTWDILRPTFTPLVSGTVVVDGVPITYGLSGQAQALSSANLTFGPGTLEEVRVFVTGPEAERLRRMNRPWINPVTGRPDYWALGGGLGTALGAGAGVGAAYLGSRPWDPEPEGTFGGDAMLRFRAVASAHAFASARLDASLGVFGGTLAAGAFAGLSASARATAPTTVDTYVSLTYTRGRVQMTSVLDLAAALELAFTLNAFAGVWVELRVPEIPVVTALSHEVQDWPIVGWIVPDLSKWKWRQEYRKDWPLFNGSYRWNMGQRFVVGNGTAAGALPDARGFAVDDLLRDAQQKQREGTLKDDPVGPGDERRNGDPGAVSAAKSAALAQIASARRAAEREQKANARLLRRARQAAAAAPQAASAGGSPPALAVGAGGGGPVAQVEERGKKLGQAVRATDQLRQRTDALKEPATSADGVSRNEARSGYEAVAANADALGDRIDRGEEGFAVPAGLEPSDAEYEKMQQARHRAYDAYDAVFDVVRTEKLYADDQLRECGSDADLRVYRHAVEDHQQRSGALWKRVQKLEGDLEKAREWYERHDHALGVVVFGELADAAGAISVEAATLRSARPAGNWDVTYAELSGGRLMLKPQYRGKATRSTFYPHDYSAATKDRMMREIGSFRTDEEGLVYWRYNGKLSPRGDHWWLLADENEQPTLDHTSPTVRVHWNSTGRKTTYDVRKSYYDFVGKGLIVVPKRENSLDGANKGGTVLPTVTVAFRGAKR